ncbi:MAG: mechanosensitive ion channel protein [Gammaproteobacteria bacterium HGW-Gammaproteobacteria-1]|jgi:small-conductance mechanosensitive channel|nr:MAG: mechanosensitive ion channel protein [Gammaproteobacteria bacterium HGW-Gammaproteobacteria-1]
MEWIDGFDWVAWLRAGLILLLGWGLAKVAGLAAGRAARRYTAAQETMLVQRVVFYGVLALSVVTALQQMGFDLGVLLGAAGILTVAVGFASQTSASNVISGLFLIGERAFVVGDTIKLGNTVGEVLSIDLLSVKLRTPDNLFVRVPNETLIKAEIVNLTRFPIRRVDLLIGVNYKEDMAKVQRVLQEVAERNPLCLTEPEPLFIFSGFGDSAMNLQFSVWAVRENFLELRNSIQREIKQAFDAGGIDIPYPQRVLHLAEPLAVRHEAPPADDKGIGDARE